MSDLNIKEKSIGELKEKDLSDFSITLKIDGTLIYYKDKRLFSPRCERSERFKHILEILNNSNFPDCFGEMYIDKPNANVFDVSKKENWKKAKFMPIDLIDNNLNYTKRQDILRKEIAELDNDFITPMILFNDINFGWGYVLDNNCEGLVIRNDYGWYKVKLLQETKVEIKEHEKGKNKGTFILINGNRISGTSEDFVNSFHKIKAENNKPIAEIEYSFLTKDNKYFQPRLRQITIDIGEVKEENNITAVRSLEYIRSLI